VSKTDLRILLNARLLDEPPSGMSRALESYLSKFQQSSDIHLDLLRTVPGNYRDFDTVVVPWPKAPAPAYVWSEFKIRRLENEYDVMHWPSQHMPPMFPKIPLVLSVWDLAYLKFSEGLDVLKYRLQYELMFGQSLKRAAVVTTYSNFAKEELLARFPSLKSKVQTVYPGLNADFEKRIIGSTPNIPETGYILYVGTLKNSKRWRLLIKAFACVLRGGDLITLKMCVSGSEMDFASLVQQLRHEKIPQESVSVLVGVATDELVELYRGAALLAFPSEYEGFGLPVLRPWLRARR
jgi:glycosyltransferase involved in cell wall biosynthesis